MLTFRKKFVLKNGSPCYNARSHDIVDDMQASSFLTRVCLRYSRHIRIAKCMIRCSATQICMNSDASILFRVTHMDNEPLRQTPKENVELHQKAAQAVLLELRQANKRILITWILRCSATGFPRSAQSLCRRAPHHP